MYNMRLSTKLNYGNFLKFVFFYACLNWNNSVGEKERKWERTDRKCFDDDKIMLISR